MDYNGNYRISSGLYLLETGFRQATIVIPQSGSAVATKTNNDVDLCPTLRTQLRQLQLY